MKNYVCKGDNRVEFYLCRNDGARIRKGLIPCSTGGNQYSWVSQNPLEDVINDDRDYRLTAFNLIFDPKVEIIGYNVTSDGK